MSYIYKITNKVNNHCYIGKTDRSVEERWKEHLKDCNRENFEKRPLYKAIKKYGKENFSIETIEECCADIVDQRERYWIEYFISFRNGYNATKGGDGRPYLDYELIYRTYLECKSRSKTAELLGIDRGNVGKIISGFKDNPYSNCEALYRPVARLDPKTGEILEVFVSTQEANKAYNCHNHVSDVCKGKRKTAGGYGWKYI